MKENSLLPHIRHGTLTLAHTHQKFGRRILRQVYCESIWERANFTNMRLSHASINRKRLIFHYAWRCSTLQLHSFVVLYNLFSAFETSATTTLFSPYLYALRWCAHGLMVECIPSPSSSSSSSSSTTLQLSNIRNHLPRAYVLHA